MIDLRPGEATDAARVAEIASEVFADYPIYARSLSRFFTTQGVNSFVAFQGGEALGFILLGFLPWSGRERDREWWMAEILGIAVLEAQRRRGVGRMLLERALALVLDMSSWRDLKEVQAVCAADSDALTLFERYGFRVADRHAGTFQSGQPAFRLALDLARDQSP